MTKRTLQIYLQNTTSIKEIEERGLRYLTRNKKKITWDRNKGKYFYYLLIFLSKVLQFLIQLE